MSLTNAQRQRLFRQRRQSQVAGTDTEAARLALENAQLKAAIRALRKHGAGPFSLTEQQHLDRAEVMADLISDRSWWRKPRKQAPLFMGFNRDGWTSMPAELKEHCGLSDAIKEGSEKRTSDLDKRMQRRPRPRRLSAIRHE